MIPQVLDRIKIRRTGGPNYDISFVFFHPTSCIDCSMRWSIVVHINPIIIIICIKYILNKHRQCFFDYVDISGTIPSITINHSWMDLEHHQTCVPHTLRTYHHLLHMERNQTDSLTSVFNRRVKTRFVEVNTSKCTSSSLQIT